MVSHSDRDFTASVGFRLRGGHRKNTLKTHHHHDISLGAAALAFCVNYTVVCLCPSGASLCVNDQRQIIWWTTAVVLLSLCEQGLPIAHRAGSGLEVVSQFCFLTPRDRFSSNMWMVTALKNKVSYILRSVLLTAVVVVTVIAWGPLILLSFV